jgi:NitT/TauT family transport system ATP-binding protein
MSSNNIPHAEEGPRGASRITVEPGAIPSSNIAAPLVVQLNGVTKRFASGLEALGGVDLAVARGEFLSLLGPSGCGKSTLLRIVAGLSEPTSGSCQLHLGGQSGKAIPAGHIGFVFQDPTLMPWSTVASNVELPFRIARRGRIAGHVRSAERDRVAASLRAVGLAGFERSYPHQLSGGMRMRVSIARALVTGPDLLLLDEPFAALDEITRHALNDDLLRLWEASRPTILFVTHSVFESVYLSTRIALMAPRPGRIVADLPVSLPQPRERTARTAPAYALMCETVSAALAAAMAQGTAT